MAGTRGRVRQPRRLPKAEFKPFPNEAGEGHGGAVGDPALQAALLLVGRGNLSWSSTAPPGLVEVTVKKLKPTRVSLGK